MPERNYYCLCEDNCKFETMTKEQILAAITQAVEQGDITDVDTGFVTKLKEMNASKQLSVWVGTQAEYNAITTPIANRLYIISDDTFGDDITDDIAELRTSVETLGADTGWLDLKRNGDTIGKYRVRSGIAYFNFEYDPSDYISAGAGVDHIILPVVLDLPEIASGQVMAYGLTAYFCGIAAISGGYSYAACPAMIDADGSTLDIYNLSMQYRNAGVRGSFSYPYKSDNPNYTEV